MKWIRNQASHGFLACEEDLRGRQGLCRWNECEKLVSRAFESVFSRHRASKMEIPVYSDEP